MRSLSAFFIDRPVFACVLAILLMLAGGLAIPNLAVEQYPEVALPQIAIYGQYPGATAKDCDQRVTQIIEQQMKGLDNLLYMSSASDSHGNIEIYFTFATGTDSDIAQVQVQNRLQLAMPLLPEPVQRQGIQASKSVENNFMVVAFHAGQDGLKANDISDYVASSLVDPLSRVTGVGSVTLYGGQNAMRIWCDPEKMHRYALNPQDIVTAVQGQNALIAAGQIGAAPAPAGQQMHFAIDASTMLQTTEEFGQIALRTEETGAVLRLRDVARVELNEESFMGKSTFNGKDAVGLAFKLASGANVLETTRAIKEELGNLSRFFPAGLQVDYIEDHAPVVEQSIHAVVRTLCEAMVLVVMVMLFFLQSWRATIIPAMAVPVVLLGTFAILAVAGFTINTLTLFGMVLAIGLLVDDAIVVVENVERLMRDRGLRPREAALASMRQVSGALVAVGLVISAVFVPMAFMDGSVGVIYRQFSITLVAAMLLSVLVALILSPTLCAHILAMPEVTPRETFFARCNRRMDRWMRRHAIAVRAILGKSSPWAFGFLVLLCLCAIMYWRLPTAFLPDEDQGMLTVDVQLPSGATFERTAKVLAQIDNYFRTVEQGAVANVMTVEGWGLSGSGQSSGMVLLQFRDWSERRDGDSVFEVAERAQKHFDTLPEAEIFVMTPSAVLELGASSGFELELMDRAGAGHDALLRTKDWFLGKAAANGALADTRYSGLDDAEQYRFSVNNDLLGTLALDRNEVNSAIAAYWGGQYINDFSDKGRSKKVYLQAEPSFRASLNHLSLYHVRNAHGEMVPFPAFLRAESVLGSPRLTRYQGVPSVKIEGNAATGSSSGDAMKAVEAIAQDLPPGFGMAWTGLSLQEKMATGNMLNLFGISLICVFLCLAALYESWIIPLTILFVAPVGIFGSLASAWLLGLHNDVYFQLAMLTIVGLSAKNSILIVTFAKALQKEGRSLAQATVIATRQRLRPILMTSLCFVLGVTPLMFGSGAGSAAQHSLGVAVFAGMLATTILGIYYTPLFLVWISRITE